MSIATNAKSFGLGVKIERSGETGTIVAFVRYKRIKEPQFLVEYTDTLGVAREGWFHRSELTLDA